MKCEKCHEKEASFYYSCNLNGHRSQRHLCADCAREEGFGGALDYEPAFGSFFGDDFFGGMFSDFFSPLPSFGSFGAPLRSIMAPAMPRLNIVIGEPQQQEQERSESKIPGDAGEDVKKRRQAESLRRKLETAVKEENFEKAIELRDALRKLEQ